MARTALSATRTSAAVTPTVDTRSVRVTCDDGIPTGSTNSYWLDLEESLDGGLNWRTVMTVRFVGPKSARGRGAAYNTGQRQSVQHRFRTVMRRQSGTPSVEAIVVLSDEPIVL